MRWGAGDSTQEPQDLNAGLGSVLSVNSQPTEHKPPFANAPETWTGLEISVDLRCAFTLIMANTETHLFRLYRLVQLSLQRGSAEPGNGATYWRKANGLENQFLLKNARCSFSQKCMSRGLWDDSAGKGVQHQNWWPESKSRMVEGKSQFLKVVLRLSPCAWYGFPCEHLKIVHLKGSSHSKYSLI